MLRHSVFAFILFLVTAPAFGINFINGNGTGLWSDPLNWNEGVLPGPSDNIWVNTSSDPGSGDPVSIVYDAANINPGTPEEGISTVGFFRLGNGTADQDFEIMSGRLNISNLGGNSWGSRWSSFNDFVVGGTGIVDVTNVGNPGVTSPAFNAFSIGLLGSTLDNSMDLSGSAEFYVRDGGALPDPQTGAPTAGEFLVGGWRGSTNFLTVRDNSLLDIARSLNSGEGTMFYEQSGGTVNIGWDFFLDRTAEYFDNGNTILQDRSSGSLTGGTMSVANNFHVTGWGAGDFTVSGDGRLNVGNVMKVNVIAEEPEDRASILDVMTDDANLNVRDGGEVSAMFWEIPTASQMVNDESHLNFDGGLVVVKDSFLGLSDAFVPTPIADPVAEFEEWANSGYLSGALSGTNADPGIAPLVKAGDLALGRGRRDSDPVDADYWFIWTTEEDVMSGVDGDFNNDGSYDCSDINALTAEIASGTNDGPFDLDGNGTVDNADLTAWLAEAGEVNLGPGKTYLLGDATLDGVVDVSDFGAWNANKFTSTAAWCSGDFNADGVVDVSDFGAWNANKFTSSDAAAVPEPAAGALMLLGAVLFAMRYRG